MVYLEVMAVIALVLLISIRCQQEAKYRNTFIAFMLVLFPLCYFNQGMHSGGVTGCENGLKVDIINISYDKTRVLYSFS